MITLFNLLFAHRVLRFIAAGGTAAAVNLGLLYFLTEWFGLWYLASAVLAFAGAFVVSFTLQKFWTFNDRRADRLHWQLPAYLAVILVNLTVNTGLLWFLVEVAGLWYLLAQIIAGGLIAVVSFFIYRRFIFHTPPSVAGS